ncbi:MAG: nucleotidyltransferase domain-containing protein [bacterium]
MPYKIEMGKKRIDRLERELREMIPRIVHLGAKKIILIGSLAKGEIHRASDIDLIVVKETDKRYLDRLDEFYSSVKPRIAMDIFVYTPEEFERMSKENQFLRSALKHGKVLYEK